MALSLRSTSPNSQSRGPSCPPADLAGKILYDVMKSGGNTIKMFADKYGVTVTQVEDALGYLVTSKYLKRDFKMDGWTIEKHRKRRPSKMRAIQPLLFGDECVQRRSRKDGDYATESSRVAERWTERTKRVNVVFPRGIGGDEWMRTKGKHEVEKDDWAIRSWNLTPARGEASPFATVLLWKKFKVWGEDAQDNGQEQANGGDEAEEEEGIEGESS